MARARQKRLQPGRKHGIVRPILDAFAEHNLLTYAAAIAFQGLVALVPLTLLWLGILGATGHGDVWTKHVAPAVEKKVTMAVFVAIDDTVHRILTHGTAGLIALSTVLSAWYLTAAVRAVIEALNKIHDVKERRPLRVRLPVTVGLGVATGAGLFGAALFVLGGPRGAGLGVVRWLGAIALLGLVVGLLVRYGPAERPRARWASVGAVLVVGSWAVASILFRLYVSDVANFRSPVGSLTALLVLTGYLYVSAIVFLVGVQLDELLRKSSGGQAKGAAELIWEALKR